MRGMTKPRLTRAVIEGIRYVLMDAEEMLAERQGWGEADYRDAAEERALLYLGQLLEWADVRSRSSFRPCSR
jgi:hypothetical protein